MGILTPELVHKARKALVADIVKYKGITDSVAVSPQEDADAYTELAKYIECTEHFDAYASDSSEDESEEEEE